MSGKKERPAGSLKTGEPAFLAAGKIRRPHGVRGELLVELYTDFPERLKPKKIVYLGEKHSRVAIRSQRLHNDGLLLGFEGFDTPEEAGALRNQTLFVARDESPALAEGEYYQHELIDLEVYLEEGTHLGTLTEIIETGANDVYVVTTPGGGEVLLPAISEVVKNIDLEAGRMIVHLLPGLLDDDSEES